MKWTLVPMVAALACGSVSAGLAQDRAADTTADPVVFVPADQWTYAQLYAMGVSARDLLGEVPVIGATGDEIGTLEDLLVDRTGDVRSAIAEVGGLWGIGTTTVSIPMSQVEVAPQNGLRVPVTEDTAEDFPVRTQLTAQTAAAQMGALGSDTATPDLWRLEDLIGEYAVLQDNSFAGRVRDIILLPVDKQGSIDGSVMAVVINSDVLGRGGFYAVPYSGYSPTSERYQIPYTQAQMNALPQFDYDLMTSPRTLLRTVAR